MNRIMERFDHLEAMMKKPEEQTNMPTSDDEWLYDNQDSVYCSMYASGLYSGIARCGRKKSSSDIITKLTAMIHYSTNLLSQQSFDCHV
jgi:hypothetical protein